MAGLFVLYCITKKPPKLGDLNIHFRLEFMHIFGAQIVHRLASIPVVPSGIYLTRFINALNRNFMQVKNVDIKTFLFFYTSS